MIYLDHAATTSLSDAALQTFIDISKEYYGNPSSIHWAGRKANSILRQARLDIAQIFDTKPEHIIFTSGGSEADTLAIQGYALANQHKGKHLITTAIEHHAVLHTMEYLEKRFGFDVTYIEPVNHTISAQQIKEALRPDTILVSVMYANNETGLLLPIREIGEILADHQAVFHVDAVQAVGKIAISPQQLGIDFLSAAAHKFHGPKGVGFLYSRIPNFDSLIHGGRQEDQHRAGTENLAGIAAMATALKEQTEQLGQHYQTVTDLKAYLLDKLSPSNYYLNETGPSLPYVVNIGFPHQLNEQLLMRLDLAGIAVSSGSACTAGVIQTSHVLEALYGQDSHRLKESIRISFSHETTKEELDFLVQQLHQIIGGTQ
ncbi:cysteine desulfurase [Streptococcus cuniculi]|uniref:cysteine desulfurase n=1 Tax=Streptococcus cuniculi TaxID=1432788 RepID=A0A1Q8E9N9_9STRE|nr:cysteine desulfurase family protein [Streptococcus cuniculi]OLF48511.1 cysteine desulfurase [Streptococcus cuniculi]